MFPTPGDSPRLAADERRAPARSTAGLQRPARPPVAAPALPRAASSTTADGFPTVTSRLLRWSRIVAWDHVRRRLPFLADFLGNILTGMAAGAARRG